MMEKRAGRRGAVGEAHVASVSIRRIGPGPAVVIEPAEELVAHFLRDDPSAQPGGYDDLAGRGERDRIALSEVIAINQTMRARSPHKVWTGIVDTDGPLPWLAALDPAWDLVTAPAALWESAIRAPVTAALSAATAPGRAVSVGTKVLHLKRPAMFPVLDSRVLEMLGWTASVPMIRVVEHLRTEGLANHEALREVQAFIAPAERSLVRILDILLWSSHPAAGLAPTMRNWEHRLRMVAPPTVRRVTQAARPSKPSMPPRNPAPGPRSPTSATVRSSFEAVWQRVGDRGGCRVVSSRGTEYVVEARLVKGRRALIAKRDRLAIYVHEDCFGLDLTCQGVRAGGLYHGHPSLLDC